MLLIQQEQSSWIQTKQTGQQYIDTSPYKVSESSLPYLIPTSRLDRPQHKQPQVLSHSQDMQVLLISLFLLLICHRFITRYR